MIIIISLIINEFHIFLAESAGNSVDSAALYTLPKHFRCAAHTLNLVASTDADKAMSSNSTYKKTCRSAFAKARELWNKQSRLLFDMINIINILH